MAAPAASASGESPEQGGRYTHLRSMTGQGRSRIDGRWGTLVTEIRSVNHRGLKVALRADESITALQPQIESGLRGRVHRGSVTIQIRWTPAHTSADWQLDESALRRCAETLRDIANSAGLTPQVDMATLATLPGMTREASPVAPFGNDDQGESDEDAADPKAATGETSAWQAWVQRGVQRAVDRLVAMRREEAVAMAESLWADLDDIAGRLDFIAARKEHVVRRHEDRLRQKIEAALAKHDITAHEIDLLKEVQVFADRSDISEEITRLGSHLVLFRGVLRDEEKAATRDSQPTARSAAAGRKLDFIVQEMFRETNTIGSKAGDAEVAEHVVEMKCAIERIRELVQNLE